MHQLDRNSVPAPVCLGAYRHGQDTWDKVTSDDRKQIRSSLERMQCKRCAYCEGDLNTLGEHIEHFRQQSRYPQGTFDWSNLFWSCTRDDSCGRHKDHCKYEHADIIKPDCEDPERFFLFLANGTITVRSNLNPKEEYRARETLRVFNLDDQRGRLRKMREIAARGYLKTAEFIVEIADCYPVEAWRPFLEQELENTRDLPFCTTLKHVLTPQGAGE
jgi:uncharacterized protein (TIGR02646 family)